MRGRGAGEANCVRRRFLSRIESLISCLANKLKWENKGEELNPSLKKKKKKKKHTQSRPQNESTESNKIKPIKIFIVLGPHLASALFISSPSYLRFTKRHCSLFWCVRGNEPFPNNIILYVLNCVCDRLREKRTAVCLFPEIPACTQGCEPMQGRGRASNTARLGPPQKNKDYKGGNKESRS